MARKKNISIIKKIRSSESVISMVLGILVVVVVGTLLFKYFRSVTTKLTREGKQVAPESQLNLEEKAGKEGEKTPLPAKYTVQKGDNLWKISTKFYGDGFNWVDISKENQMKNPNQLEEGKKLVIPNVPVRKPVTTIKEDAQTISVSSYTVVKGDTLWKISVRAYQDGYKWPEIAKANNLSNPSLIHPGNVLTIPR